MLLHVAVMLRAINESFTHFILQKKGGLYRGYITRSFDWVHRKSLIQWRDPELNWQNPAYETGETPPPLKSPRYLLYDKTDRKFHFFLPGFLCFTNTSIRFFFIFPVGAFGPRLFSGVPFFAMVFLSIIIFYRTKFAWYSI